MYTITREEVLAAARVLTHPLCTGIATYIINEHWQAVANKKNPFEYEIITYEHMNDQMGYLEGKHFLFAAEDFNESNVADILYAHIVNASREWDDLLTENNK